MLIIFDFLGRDFLPVSQKMLVRTSDEKIGVCVKRNAFAIAFNFARLLHSQIRVTLCTSSEKCHRNIPGKSRAAYAEDVVE